MRVLHIVGAMNLGGQESFIMNAYRKIDRNAYQFDYIVSNKNKGYFDDEIKNLGGRIYYIPEIKKRPIKRCIELYRIIKNNNYSVIHRHSAFSIVFIDLLVAKIAGVKIRIIHSHADYDPHRIHSALRKLVVLYSNYRFACSEKAGKWMYGEKSNFEVLFNGVDTDAFKYDETNRKRIRAELGIAETDILIGHTGRLTPEKNHKFLIDLLSDLIKDNKNIYMAFIGDGFLRDELIQYCSERGVSNNVFFCGLKNNVNEFLSAFDCFFFPSIHEGLGISLIEAELNGLYCLVSENINDEAIIGENVKKLPLEINCWTEAFKGISNDLNHKHLSNDIIQRVDIEATVKRLEEVYDKTKNK